MTKTRLAATVAVLTLTGAVATAANPAGNRRVALANSGAGLAPIVFRSALPLNAEHAVFHAGARGRVHLVTDEEDDEDDPSAFEDYFDDDQAAMAGSEQAQNEEQDQSSGQQAQGGEQAQSGGQQGQRGDERRGDRRAERREGNDREGRGFRRGGMMALRRLCGPRGGEIMERRLFRLERITRPTEAQRPAFERLKDAVMRASEQARAGCPTERPMTPTGRLAAAEKRLEALLQAIKTVRPPLEEYFAGLSEEQKARVYAGGRGSRWGNRGGWRERYREHWRRHHGWGGGGEERRGWRGRGEERRWGRYGDDDHGWRGNRRWRENRGWRGDDEGGRGPRGGGPSREPDRWRGEL